MAVTNKDKVVTPLWVQLIHLADDITSGRLDLADKVIKNSNHKRTKAFWTVYVTFPGPVLTSDEVNTSSIRLRQWRSDCTVENLVIAIQKLADEVMKKQTTSALDVNDFKKRLILPGQITDDEVDLLLKKAKRVSLFNSEYDLDEDYARYLKS